MTKAEEAKKRWLEVLKDGRDPEKEAKKRWRDARKKWSDARKKGRKLEEGEDKEVEAIYLPMSWELTFNHNKGVQEDLSLLFLRQFGGWLTFEFGLLSRFYRNLDKQDRPGDEEDFFLSICQPAFDAHDTLHNPSK